MEKVVEICGCCGNETDIVIRIKVGTMSECPDKELDAKHVFDLFYDSIPSETFNRIREMMNSKDLLCCK